MKLGSRKPACPAQLRQFSQISMLVLVLLWSLVVCYGILPKFRPSQKASQLDSTQDSQLDSTQDSQCRPVQHVMYLKVFKTGSSTIQNLCYRYAWNNNLTIVPVFRDPYREFDFERHFVPLQYHRPDIVRYDIFPEHIYLFNKEKILKYMPNDTFFIASVRHPLSQFQSLFKEFRFLRTQFNLTSKDPSRELLMKGDETWREKEELGYPIMVCNTMAWQFGLINYNGLVASPLKKKLEQISDSFGVVFIKENFFQSLILFRRQVCWEHQDIVHYALRHRVSHKESNSNELLKLHKSRCPADYKIYEHFLTLHKRRMASQPNDFFEELQHFKIMNEKVIEYCEKVLSSKNGRGNEALHIEASQWSPEFTLRPTECVHLKLNNHVFRSALLIRQMPEICNNQAKRSSAVNMPQQHGNLLAPKSLCHDLTPEYFREVRQRDPWEIVSF